MDTCRLIILPEEIMTGKEINLTSRTPDEMADLTAREKWRNNSRSCTG